MMQGVRLANHRPIMCLVVYSLLIHNIVDLQSFNDVTSCQPQIESLPAATHDCSCDNKSTNESRKVAAGDTSAESLPDGATQRFGTERFRVATPGPIQFSADSQLLIVKNLGRLIAINRETGLRVHDLRFNPGQGHVSSSAISGDGKLVAMVLRTKLSNDPQSEVRIVVVNTETNRRQILLWPECRGSIVLFQMSPDQRTLVAATNEDRSKFWNLETGEEIATPNQLQFVPRAAAFSRDGQTLVVVGQDKKTQIWKWRTTEPPRELAREPGDSPLSVKFSPDGKWFAVGYSSANGLRFFDAVTGELAWQIETLGKSAHLSGSVAFTSDSRLVAVPLRTANAVQLWNLETRKRLRSFECYGPRFTAISPDNQWLATSGDDCVIHVWNLTTGKPVLAIPEGHTRPADRLCFSADGQMLISSSTDNTVRVWDVATGRHRLKLDQKPGRPIRGLSISPDNLMGVSSALDDALGVWDLSTGKRLPDLAGHGRKGASRPIRFTTDGSRFATWGEDLQLRWWNAGNGQLLATHVTTIAGLKATDPRAFKEDEFTEDEYVTGKFSSDAATLLIFHRGKLHEFDTATGRVQRAIVLEKTSRFFLSADNHRLVTIHYDYPPRQPEAVPTPRQLHVTVQDFDSLEIVKQFDVPQSGVETFTMSPDARCLAILKFDDRSNDIEIVSLKTGAITARIPIVSGCTAMEFSPEGNRLATAHRNTTILLWEIDRFAVK